MVTVGGNSADSLGGAGVHTVAAKVAATTAPAPSAGLAGYGVAAVGRLQQNEQRRVDLLAAGGFSRDGAGEGVLALAAAASAAAAARHGILSSGGDGAPNGLAGKFVGNVQVTGNLSKGGGSFKIDHPLDPENKYPTSFVESPDMKNIYDGNVTTDANGEATVEFAGLVRGVEPRLPLSTHGHRHIRASHRRREDQRKPLRY